MPADVKIHCGIGLTSRVVGNNIKSGDTPWSNCVALPWDGH